jgi:hypothetical protein
MGITLIFKGKDWGGKSTSTGRRTISLDPEKVLSDKIEQGKVLDKDIQDIIKSGDAKLLKKLHAKENEQIKKKSDMEQKYGINDKKLFDGIDSNNCFYKDIKLDKLEND